MPTSCLSMFTPTSASVFITKNFVINRSKTKNYIRCSRNSSSCSSSITEFNLYELLGIESNCNQSQIRTAYRALQKRCHPDIAGPAGHDMAIVLNEAYSVLSDPSSRSAYDKEQAKIGELKGYTGKPIYSTWFGSENEQRAIFVDEVKCVGCLKCALFAENTFAIESVYGRARAVAQWADPEHQIQAAIDTCPVDCISIVERSDLPALEFLMSKQPRGNVRVGAGTTGGARVANIFVDVKKFQTRFADSMNKSTSESCRESARQREARISVIKAISLISNWLYWQSPRLSSQDSSHDLARTMTRKSTDPNIKRLQEAVAARKHGPAHRPSSRYLHHSYYWTPSKQALPEPVNHGTGISKATSQASRAENLEEMKRQDPGVQEKYKRNPQNPIKWGIPLLTATIGVVRVYMQLQEGAVVGGLKDHIGGSLALEIVNSPWLQVTLAGATWYVIGVGIIELVEIIRDGRLQSRKF